MVDISNATSDESGISAEEYERLLDAYNSNIAEGEVVSGKVLQIAGGEVVAEGGARHAHTTATRR